MKLDGDFETTGWFWLPNHDDKKLPGILEISEEGKPILETLGTFVDDDLNSIVNNINSDDANIGRIVGILEDGKAVTLEGCYYKNRKFVLAGSGIDKATISARFAFVGVMFEAEEKVRFSRLCFFIEGLNEWISETGINISYEFIEEERNGRIKNKLARLNIFYHPLKKIASDNSGPIAISFGFVSTVPTGANIVETKITQNACIELSSKILLPLDEYLHFISKIINFLCFSIDETVGLLSIKAFSEELAEEIDGERLEHPVDIYYAGYQSGQKTKYFKPRNMLFQYKHVKKNIGEVFDKWLEVYEQLEPAYNLYFSTKGGAHVYVESKFLSLIQGVETYHRRTSKETLMTESDYRKLLEKAYRGFPKEHLQWLKGRLQHGNEIPLRKRLTKMIEPFKIYFGSSKERSKLIASIVDTRNYLTHYDPGMKDKSMAAVDLYDACKKMECLYQLHMLKAICLDNTIIEKIIADNDKFKRYLKSPVAKN